MVRVSARASRGGSAAAADPPGGQGMRVRYCTEPDASGEYVLSLTRAWTLLVKGHQETLSAP